MAQHPVILACRHIVRLSEVHFVDKVVDLLFGRHKRGLRVRESILDVPDRDCQLGSGFLFLISVVNRRAADSAYRKACVVSLRAREKISRFTGFT